jgi:hypothetical protein
MWSEEDVFAIFDDLCTIIRIVDISAFPLVLGKSSSVDLGDGLFHRLVS